MDETTVETKVETKCKMSNSTAAFVSEATLRLNPMRQIRDRHGLDRNQLSIMLGIAYMPIYNIETGNVRVIGKGISQAMQDAGIDAEEFKKDYEAWRRVAREEMIRNMLRARDNGIVEGEGAAAAADID